MRVLIRISDVRLAGVALLRERAIGGTGRLIEGVKRGVRSLQGFVRRCCFVSLAVPTLAACVFIDDTLDVNPFLHEQITGDTWGACLAREYQYQARLQVRSGRNWNAATSLASKGRRALSGSVVDPESSPSALSAESTSLSIAISNRARNPCDCAKVQGRFDGWVIAFNQDSNQDLSPFSAAFFEAVDACTKPR